MGYLGMWGGYLLTVTEIKHTLHQNKYIMELNIAVFDNRFIEAHVI